MSDFRISEQLVRVLDVLLDDPTSEHYGLAVANAAGLRSGTLYPIMARLEKAGWLESRWETDDTARGPRRRLYRFTTLGLAQAPPLVNARRLPAAAGRKSMLLRPALQPKLGW